MAQAMQPGNKGITDKHSKSLSQIASDQLTVTLFGKLVNDMHVDPSSSGIPHPKGLNEPMQVAEIVGCLDNGQCVTLKPYLCSLPAPDGPASSCRWDPREYVEWRNIPRNWETLHLTATTAPVGDLIQSRGLPAAAVTDQLMADQIVTIIADCINHVTGSTRQIVMANTLQPYGFDTQDQVDTLAAYIVGNSNFGVRRYNFKMSGADLSGMTSSWTLVNIFGVIQAKAVPA